MDTAVHPRDAILQVLTLVFCETVAKRIVCAVLLAYGISEKDAAAFVQICLKSAHKYHVMLNSIDASALLHISSGNHPGKLFSVKQLILGEIDKGMYRTLRQIKLKLKEAFGIEISHARISVFLKVNGYRLLRCASLPAKANYAEQRRFYWQELVHLIAGAKRNEIALYFMDAAHFIYGIPTPGRVYANTRRFIRTSCGRMRYNVLASIDFVSKQVTTVANDTYIRAEQVIELLKKLASKRDDKPIVVVLDNAKYQHCDAVQSCAEELNILLCYLPSYSPNLNLIERYWKYIKSEVLNGAYLGTFDKYKQLITTGIQESYTIHKDKLNSLINYKVQLYDDQGISVPFECSSSSLLLKS